MVKISHPSLGVLEFDEDGVADSQIRLGDATIEFDIWFEEDVDASRLDRLAALLPQVEHLHESNLAAIAANLASGDEDAAPVLHRSLHRKEFDAQELDQVFGTAKPGEVDDATYLRALKLRRIGAYPDAEEPHLTWDYGFDPELSDHLVAIQMSLSFDIVQISLES